MTIKLPKKYILNVGSGFLNHVGLLFSMFNKEIKMKKSNVIQLSKAKRKIETSKLKKAMGKKSKKTKLMEEFDPFEEEMKQIIKVGEEEIEKFRKRRDEQTQRILLAGVGFFAGVMGIVWLASRD